jgi:glycosyltransferase involved in cell wall biosynthesis
MLVLVDPSLRSYNGHFLTYDASIAAEIQHRGQDCIVFASKTVQDVASSGLKIIPCFSQGLEEPSPNLSEIFFEELTEGAAIVGNPSAAIYFLHTCTPAQIEPAARFIKSAADCRLIILLRYSPTINPMYPDCALVERYRNALQSIVAHDVQDRVRLVTDSILLSDEYRLLTDLPIHLVPIPHVGISRTEIDHHPATLVYLGNARSSKGFSYLQHLVAAIRPELLSGQWAFEIQANVMFARDDESVIAIPVLRNEPVKLWESELSLDEYSALLVRAALVVIPYSTSWYHSQSSGVFAEAIGAGKPVVVPRGTWMADQLRFTGAGITFAPGDRADLVRATREAMDNIASLTGNAGALQPTWTAIHNPKAFVQALLAE